MHYHTMHLPIGGGQRKVEVFFNGNRDGLVEVHQIFDADTYEDLTKWCNDHHPLDSFNVNYVGREWVEGRHDPIIELMFGAKAYLLDGTAKTVPKMYSSNMTFIEYIESVIYSTGVLHQCEDDDAQYFGEMGV